MNILHSRKGLTAVELLVILFVFAAIGALLLPALAPLHHHNGCSRQVKDATQLRGLHQGLMTFAQQHASDLIPTPSATP